MRTFAVGTGLKRVDIYSRLCAAFLIRPADKLCSCFASSAPVRLPRGDSIKGQWIKFLVRKKIVL